MQWHLFLLPNLCAMAMSIALAVQVSRRSDSPAKRPFLGLIAIIAVWNFIYVLSVAASEPALKFFFMKWRLVPTAFTGATALVLFSAFIGEPIVMNRRRALALFGIPTISAVTALVGDPLHWVFSSMRVLPGTPLIVAEHAFWGRVQVVHGWLTFVAGLVLLVSAALRAAPPYRQQLWFVVALVIPPTILDFLHATGHSPIPGYNFAPAFIALTSAGFAYAMQKYRLIDLAPVARRVVVDRMPNAMLVADPDGKIVDVNQAASDLLGIDRTQIGSALTQSLTEPSLVELLTKTAHEGTSEVTVRSRVFDASVSPLSLGDRVVGRVLVLHDVTERKEREEQIRRQAQEVEELSRVRDAFVTTVSHELRTPLNVIIGLTDLLREESLPEQATQRVEMIHDAGELLLALVSDVLSLAKLRSGKLELEAIPFAPGQTLIRSAGLFETVASQKGIALRTSIPADLPTLVGDPTRVQQIVVNLLGNAVKFTQQGEIELSARYDDGRLTIRVTDTGVGIPPEKRASVFEAFAQADTSTTRRFGGTGLGLTIVHGLVESMRGTIGIDANQPHGTVFTVTVPLEVDAQATAVQRPISKEDLRALMTSSGSHSILTPERAPTLGPPRVLIVDDVYENRLLLQEMLRKEPIEVTLAENGREALEQFRTASFDLVLLDIEMPEQDGYSVVREMRAWEARQTRAPVYIAALTAHGLPEHEGRSKEAGFSTHLTKPVRKKELLELLGRR